MSGEEYGRSPTLTELLARSMRAAIARVHTFLPGEVISYDAAAQTASVKPALKNVVEADGGQITVDYPVISDVPVLHPRGGGWFVHFPLVAGDTVVLGFAERALDTFRQLGGARDPLDLRMHDLADALAWPVNLYVDGNALDVADGFSFGREGGTTVHVRDDGIIALGTENPASFIALAGSTANAISALRNSVDVLTNAFNAHVHATAATGPPVIPTPVPGLIPVANPAVVGSVASTKVKAL